MPRIDPEQFANRVFEASKAAFTSLIEENAGPDFYAFALWTDDSLQFLNPAANTEEALTATVQRYREKVDPKYGHTSTRAGMRWSYGDWGFFPYEGGGYFDEINGRLAANLDDLIDDEEFDEDSDCELEPLWDAVLDGFRRLESEGFFGTGPARLKITLLLVGHLPQELVDAWVIALNPPEVAERYLNWNFGADDGE